MTKIILLGEKKDSSLTLPMCRSLEKNGGVLYCGFGCISEYSEITPKFVIYETDLLENCNTDNTIIVLKSGTKCKGIELSGHDRLCVVCELNGLNDGAQETPVVTCSMNAGGNISLSSISPESVLLCIQKPIKLLNGKLFEPCEIEVKTTAQTGSYELLAICAVLILSGSAEKSLINL